MPRTISDEDAAKIAEKLADRLSKQEIAGFTPTEHLKAHQQLEDLLSVWKTTRSTVIKTLVGLLLTAAIFVASIKFGGGGG